ncbi:MAG: alpha/beta hydrolase [Candidatus Caldarchaeum sp.]
MILARGETYPDIKLSAAEGYIYFFTAAGKAYVEEMLGWAELSSWSEHVAAGSKVYVDGVETFYVERGGGRAVLLVHGWASSSFSWRNSLPTLSKRYRTIAVDLPGFGMSQRLPTGLHLENLALHLTRFLDIIGVEKFSLIGHSMGGVVSTYVAASWPSRVEKLVLVNPSLFGSEAGRRPIMMEVARKRPFGGLLTRLFVSRFIIRRVLRNVYVKKELVDDYLVEGYYQSVKRAGTVLLEAVNIMREFSLDVVSRITCPTLFVLGEHDTIVPFEKCRQLAEQIGARIYVDPGSGHSVHEENPAAVNNVILEFLKDC